MKRSRFRRHGSHRGLWPGRSLSYPRAHPGIRPSGAPDDTRNGLPQRPYRQGEKEGLKLRKGLSAELHAAKKDNEFPEYFFVEAMPHTLVAIRVSPALPRFLIRRHANHNLHRPQRGYGVCKAARVMASKQSIILKTRAKVLMRSPSRPMG